MRWQQKNFVNVKFRSTHQCVSILSLHFLFEDTSFFSSLEFSIKLHHKPAKGNRYEMEKTILDKGFFRHAIYS